MNEDQQSWHGSQASGQGSLTSGQVKQMMKAEQERQVLNELARREISRQTLAANIQAADEKWNKK